MDEDIRARGYSPTVRKRALGRRLVELRKACGLTTTDVQERLGWSASKLNYIEKAKWIDRVSDQVDDLCELYGVEGTDREALIILAREARQRGWWRKYGDVFPRELPGFEDGASLIRVFENAVVPGLLQAPSYIEHITRAAGITDPAEVKHHVEARLHRQQILTRPGPCHLHAVIDENAIARITDPAIRRDQLTHLTEAAARPTTEIQILPTSAGVYPTTGTEPFNYLSYPDPTDRDIVYLETAAGDQMLENPDELTRYKLKFDKLRTIALTPTQTTTYLHQQNG